MNTRNVVWWKVILGVLLVYIEAKQFISPGSRAFQPSNSTQAGAMIFVQCALLLVGLWLTISGIRGTPSRV